MSRIKKSLLCQRALTKNPRGKYSPQFPLPYLRSRSVFTQFPSINLMHTMTLQITCLRCLPQSDPVTKYYYNLQYKSQVPTRRGR